VHDDGRAHDPGEVDVIIVFADSTHPALCGSIVLRRGDNCSCR
jgi:hypothetical protein